MPSATIRASRPCSRQPRSAWRNLHDLEDDRDRPAGDRARFLERTSRDSELSVSNARHKQGKLEMINFGYGGILGILILIGDVWALINILQSSAANDKKLLWVVVVV